MSEVIISVRGEHEARIAPERAVAAVRVNADGHDRGAVVERVASLAQPLRDKLTESQSAGTVDEWSSEHVAIWSDRPWNADGAQLPLVHHASVTFRAVFVDFPALSWWLGELAETEGVQVENVSWKLTPATRTLVEAEVATRAVSVAVERARAYASALGLETVTPVEIADVGLLGRPEGPQPAPRMMMAAAPLADGGGDTIRLQPQDVTVSAGVEARFAAR